jgi:hypothetical protein
VPLSPRAWNAGAQFQLQPGGLKSSVQQLTAATVLIGPGTGIAPLRSMHPLADSLDNCLVFDNGNEQLELCITISSLFALSANIYPSSSQVAPSESSSSPAVSNLQSSN